MKSFLALFCALATLSDWSAAAEIREKALSCLLVVDTSLSMARQKTAVAEIISGLVQTGMEGRLRSGESFAVWTFNERVATNRIVRQVWAPEHGLMLGSYIARFLADQRFEKQTRMDRFLTELAAAMAGPEFVTALLFTDGDTPMKGTPFDASINQVYQRYRRDSRRMKKPFVTTLVGQNGVFVAWAVSRPGEAIRWPEFFGAPAPASIVTTQVTPELRALEKSDPRATSELKSSAANDAAANVVTNGAAIQALPPAAPTSSVETNKIVVIPAPAAPIPQAPKETPSEVGVTEAVQKRENPGTSLPVVQPSVSEASNLETRNQPPPAIASHLNPASQKIEAIVDSSSTPSVVPAARAPQELPPPPSVAEPAAASVTTNLLATTTVSPGHSMSYLTAGLAFLVSAAAILTWWLRGGRRAKPSLISRSLDDRRP